MFVKEVCVWVSTVIRNTADMAYIISQKQRVLDGLKLGCGFLLIVVNCCAACRAAMCVGYMKCLLKYSASLVPFDVHFQLGLLCKACRNTLFDLTELHRTKMVLSSN